MLPWLAWNSLGRAGFPQTHREPSVMCAPNQLTTSDQHRCHTQKGTLALVSPSVKTVSKINMTEAI